MASDRISPIIFLSYSKSSPPFDTIYDTIDSISDKLEHINPDGNFDRIRALGMLMLYREEKMVLYGGNLQKEQEVPTNYLGNDEFFSTNFDNRFMQLQ